MSPRRTAPAPAGSASQVAALRADLAAARFTTDYLADLLGPVAGAALHRDQPLPVLRLLAGSREPAAVLVRFLVLGKAEETDVLDDAFPRTTSTGLLELGLAVTTEGGLLQATADVRPYGDERHEWWVASDVSQSVLADVLPTDHVLGIGGASTTLASWTPRPAVDRALDLGTGCGVQALHLSGHADHVVATDLSARALAYARFNARLNDLALELRHGSLLAPVEGEKFDLVVSNPPFVITPRSADVPLFEYRDGGAVGDALVAGLVTDLVRVLAPGGVAQLLGNWELVKGESWTDRVSRWLESTPLDAWVIQRETQDVAEYAETWARDGGHRAGTAAFDALYGAWLDDFAARGVERIGFGIITLQRPSSPRQPFRHCEELLHQVAQPAGPAVLAGLQARTWVAEHSAEDLLATRWSVAADVTEERIGRPGGDDPMVIQLRQGSGLRRTMALDTATAGLVGASDGELTAGQIVRGICVLTQQPVQALTAEVLPMLRLLVTDGFLR